MARFQEILPNRGVDNRPSGKDWMMVPEGGDNHVRLVDGDGYDVDVSDPRHHISVSEVKTKDRVLLLKELTATIPSEHRIFRVHGRSAGPATVVAKKGSDSTKIEVSVKQQKSYTIAYYFLQDPGSKEARTRSIFSSADTDGWIASLNEVYGRQANLWFSKAKEKSGVCLLPLAGLPEAVGVSEA